MSTAGPPKPSLFARLFKAFGFSMTAGALVVATVGAVYFLMSEDNVRQQLKLPWMSFESDAAAVAPEGESNSM